MARIACGSDTDAPLEEERLDLRLRFVAHEICVSLRIREITGGARARLIICRVECQSVISFLVFTMIKDFTIEPQVDSSESRNIDFLIYVQLLGNADDEISLWRSPINEFP